MVKGSTTNQQMLGNFSKFYSLKIFETVCSSVTSEICRYFIFMGKYKWVV